MAGSVAFFVLGTWQLGGKAFAVPAEQLVALENGRLDNLQWKVSAHAGTPKPAVRSMPCLRVEVAGHVERRGRRNSLSLCGALEQSPLLVVNSMGSGRTERTVLALAFESEVVKVRLWFSNRKTRTVLLRKLSRYKARKARIQPFRYSAIGFAHEFCLLGYAAFDTTGQRIEVGRGMHCANR